MEVRLVKKGGLPMTYTGDPDVDASAIRMIDLEKKFHLGHYELADAADVPRGKAVALRRHLGLDADDDHFSHAFVFGKSKHLRYSDNAVRAMKKSGTGAVKGIPPPVCGQLFFNSSASITRMPLGPRT